MSGDCYAIVDSFVVITVLCISITFMLVMGLSYFMFKYFYYIFVNFTHSQIIPPTYFFH